MDEVMKGLAAMLPPEMGLDALPDGMKEALMQAMKKPRGGGASGQIGEGAAS